MRNAPNTRGGRLVWHRAGHGRAPRPRPAQHRADPRHEFARAEWLGHVVIGPDRQPDDGVHLGVTSGEHHHVGVGERSQLPTRLQTVDAGQRQVEHDDIGVELAGHRDGVMPVVGDADLEVLTLQVAGDHAGQGHLVIDDQCPVPR